MLVRRCRKYTYVRAIFKGLFDELATWSPSDINRYLYTDAYAELYNGAVPIAHPAADETLCFGATYALSMFLSSNWRKRRHEFRSALCTTRRVCLGSSGSGRDQPRSNSRNRVTTRDDKSEIASLWKKLGNLDTYSAFNVRKDREGDDREDVSFKCTTVYIVL